MNNFHRILQIFIATVLWNISNFYILWKFRKFKRNLVDWVMLMMFHWIIQLCVSCSNYRYPIQHSNQMFNKSCWELKDWMLFYNHLFLQTSKIWYIFSSQLNCNLLQFCYKSFSTYIDCTFLGVIHFSLLFLLRQKILGHLNHSDVNSVLLYERYHWSQLWVSRDFNFAMNVNIF